MRPQSRSRNRSAEISRSPGSLNLDTEQPQRQHVPKHVADGGVQEQISHYLPDGKRLHHLRGHEREIFKELVETRRAPARRNTE